MNCNHHPHHRHRGDPSIFPPDSCIAPFTTKCNHDYTPPHIPRETELWRWKDSEEGRDSERALRREIQREATPPSRRPHNSPVCRCTSTCTSLFWYVVYCLFYIPVHRRILQSATDVEHCTPREAPLAASQHLPSLAYSAASSTSSTPYSGASPSLPSHSPVTAVLHWRPTFRWPLLVN